MLSLNPKMNRVTLGYVNVGQDKEGTPEKTLTGN
tara:strand:- start:380 stop:481 length:102 start_codon:yes stop_codon:yes gene_type:complete